MLTYIKQMGNFFLIFLNLEVSINIADFHKIAKKFHFVNYFLVLFCFPINHKAL